MAWRLYRVNQDTSLFYVFVRHIPASYRLVLFRRGHCRLELSTVPVERNTPAMTMKKYCTSCGHVAHPVPVKKGSSTTSFFLTLLFLLPGIIYMIWRSNSGHEACPSCGSPQVIPVDSPMAQKLMGDDYHKMKEAEAQERAARQELAARQQKEYEAAQAAEAAKPWLKRNGAGLVATIGGLALVVGIVYFSIQNAPKMPTHASEPASVHHAASLVTDVISHCGKPSRDFTKVEGGSPTRHIIYKRQNVELMYYKTGELVGRFTVQGDDLISVGEAEERLPCATGYLLTPVDAAAAN